MCRLQLRTETVVDNRVRAVGAPHVPAGTMPKDWPAQPRFLEVLKSMRVASRPKLTELEALAVADARSFYKHAVAILTKQIQARKPRHRVAVLYAINALVTHHADAETAKLYAGRFAPEVRACVAAALECPPEHVSGVRRVLKRWRRRACFSASVLDDAAALVGARRRESGAEREPASGGASSRETSVLADAEDAEKEEEYVLSEADDNDGDDENDGRDAGARPVDARRETRSGADAPTAPAPFKPSLDFAKSRVNRWPTKKPVAAKPPAVSVSANPPPPTAPSAVSANPPPPVSAANPPPPFGSEKEKEAARARPPVDRPRGATVVSPSPPRERSPQTAAGALASDARRRDEALDARSARADGVGERGSREGRRDAGTSGRIGHRSEQSTGLGVGRGGRGGASGRVPVDKWGDPIRREGGGRVDLGKRRRSRSRSRDARRRRDGERREGSGDAASAARARRGRSRSRSRERVRSPVR